MSTTFQHQQVTRVSSIDRHGERVTKLFRSAEAASVEAYYRRRRGHKQVRVESELRFRRRRAASG